MRGKHRYRQPLAATQGGLVGDDAWDGHIQRFVNSDFRWAAVHEGIDELVCEEGVGAIVTAVVAERPGEQVGLPPLRLVVRLFLRQGTDEAAIVLLGLVGGAPD